MYVLCTFVLMSIFGHFLRCYFFQNLGNSFPMIWSNWMQFMGMCGSKKMRIKKPPKWNLKTWRLQLFLKYTKAFGRLPFVRLSQHRSNLFSKLQASVTKAARAWRPTTWPKAGPAWSSWSRTDTMIAGFRSSATVRCQSHKTFFFITDALRKEYYLASLYSLV